VRRILALLLLVGAADAAPKKASSTVVTVTQRINNQCGGVARRPEFDTRTPVADALYLVRRGKTNTPTKVIAQAKSDTHGRLYFDLPRGTYCLITPAKRDAPKGPPTADELTGPLGRAAPSPVGVAIPEELTDAEKRECDLVFVAPTRSARLEIYSSSCPPIPPGTAPPA
jgi:hypothetical protein